MDNHEKLNREDIIQYLNSRKSYFHSAFHIRKIALIGSFARNEQNPGSDIDIIVDVDPSIGLDIVTLADEIEHLLGEQVDVMSHRAIN